MSTKKFVYLFSEGNASTAMTLVQEELNKQGTISHISDAAEDRIRDRKSVV